MDRESFRWLTIIFCTGFVSSVSAWGILCDGRRYGTCHRSAEVPWPNKSGLDNKELLPRFYEHVRHLQTLRFAYVTATLTAVGAVTSFVFGKENQGFDVVQARCVAACAVAVLGGSGGVRVLRFTKLIDAELWKIKSILGSSTTRQGLAAYCEAVLVWLVTLVLAVWIAGAGLLLHLG